MQSQPQTRDIYNVMSIVSISQVLSSKEDETKLLIIIIIITIIIIIIVDYCHTALTNTALFQTNQRRC